MSNTSGKNKKYNIIIIESEKENRNMKMHVI